MKKILRCIWYIKIILINHISSAMNNPDGISWSTYNENESIGYWRCSNNHIKIWLANDRILSLTLNFLKK